METLAIIGPGWVLAVAFCVAFLSGLVKGVVGFAMPTVMFSGLGSLISPELALAGIILPTLISNMWQALRQGMGAAWGSLKRFRVFMLCGAIALIISAQLVPAMSQAVLFLIIGVPITGYALSSLMGTGLRIRPDAGKRVEASIGALAGFFGGISGIWGPPTVALLSSRGTEKTEQMRVQGVIYGVGALLLTLSHIGSGVLRAQTLPFSLALVPPAVLGIALGFWLHDRIDQRMFHRATLAVLLIAGLNLVRRGLVSF